MSFSSTTAELKNPMGGKKNAAEIIKKRQSSTNGTSPTSSTPAVQIPAVKSTGNLLTDGMAHYRENTPVLLQAIDVYLVFVMMTGVIQFVYMLLVGTFYPGQLLLRHFSLQRFSGRLHCICGNVCPGRESAHAVKSKEQGILQQNPRTVYMLDCLFYYIVQILCRLCIL